VYEGVVLGHRVHVDSLRERFAIGRVARLSGGAARSAVWSQLFSDALDLEIEVPACEETGARGAALLGALGIGWYGSLAEAAEGVEIGRRNEPDSAGVARMSRRYETFVAAAEALRPFWEKF
jgi:L-xylulokinase